MSFLSSCSSSPKLHLMTLQTSKTDVPLLDSCCPILDGLKSTLRQKAYKGKSPPEKNAILKGLFPFQFLSAFGHYPVPSSRFFFSSIIYHCFLQKDLFNISYSKIIGVELRGRFQIMDYISFLGTGLSRFLIFSCLTFDKSCYSKNLN